MSEELVRFVEIGVAGIVVTMATHFLGMFRMELLGVVFSLTTLSAQSIVAFLEEFGGTPVNADRTDPLP
jgi:hypothetical protein